MGPLIPSGVKVKVKSGVRLGGCGIERLAGPDFMKPLEGKGEPVTVGENGQANVAVNLIPADGGAKL